MGGLLWRFCGEQQGSRRRQTDIFASTGNIQAQVLLLGTELDCCQLGRPYSIHISKVPPLGASVDPVRFKSDFIHFVTNEIIQTRQFAPHVCLLLQEVHADMPHLVFMGCTHADQTSGSALFLP